MQSAVNKTPHKVVFDTQVFLRALINPKSASGRLVLNLQVDYVLYTADQIDREVLDVLSRPKIRQKFPQITDERIKLITTLLELAHRVEVKDSDIQPICRDPKDDIFLACAKLAKANYLVSEDNDLLVLKSYEDTQIVNVIEFLAVLQDDTSDSEGES